MSEVTSIILSYLVRHPSAKDTLEGIAGWWLLDEQINQAIEKVSQALDYLVSKDFVLVKRLENQEKYYQLNIEKMKVINDLLLGIAQKSKENE